MSLASLLTSTATVYRVSTSQDTVGGLVRTFTAIYEDIPCLVQPNIGTGGGDLVEPMSKRRIESGHVLYTTAAVSAMPGDRVSSGGVDYIVRFAADHGGHGRLYAIYMDQVTG